MTSGPVLSAPAQAPIEPRRAKIARDLARSTVLYGLAGAIGKALALVTVPLLTRLLQPSVYGLADLATTVAALMTLFALFAGDLPTARAHALAKPDERRGVLASYLLATAVVSTIAAAVMFPLASLIAAAWNAPDETTLAQLAIVLVPISAMQSATVTTLRLVDRPVAFAALATLDLVAQLVLAVVFVLMGWGAHGIVLGFVIGSLVGLAAACGASWRHWSARPEAGQALRLVGHGAYYLPAAVAFLLADYISRSIVAGSLGQAAVGYLGVAFRLASVMALATAAFSLAWGPMGMGRRQGPTTAVLFGQVLQVITLGLLGLALAAGSIGPELVGVISGTRYGPAAAALPGLLAASALGAAFFVLTVAAGVSERARVIAAAATVGALVQVGASAALVAPLGLAGIGAAALAGHVISIAIVVPAVRGAVAIPRWPFAGTVAVAFTAAIGLSLLNAREGPLVIRGLLGLAAAAGGIWLLTRVLRESITPVASARD